MRPRSQWFPTLPALALLLAACASSNLPPIGRVMPVVGDTGHQVVSWTVLSGANADGRSVLWAPVAALLLGKGDAAPVPLRPEDSLPLRVDLDESFSWMHGRVVSIDLGKDGVGRWLTLASSRELAGLRYVAVPDSVTEAMQIALARLAKVNPHVMLAVEDSAATVKVLPFFRPTALVLSGGDASIPALLSAQSQVEEVWLGGDDVAAPVAAALLALPKLRRLLITANVDSMPRLPAGLEELTIMDDRGELDARLLSTPTTLRVLRLRGTTWRNGFDLAEAKQLRWLALPTNVTQAEFEALVRAHPALEVLELEHTDSVVDLSPLRGLAQLRALAIEGTPAQLAVVKDLRSLEYLAVLMEGPDEDLVGPLIAVRTALPDVALVEWRPMCLGSGWILLLAPLVALLVYAWPRRRAA